MLYLYCRKGIKMLNLNLGDQLKEQLTLESKELGLSLSAYIRMILNKRKHNE